jgi:hypothetical protein
MKKLLFSLLFIGAISLGASAQITDAKANDKKAKLETRHSETKIKRTSTPKQKVHNLLHRKNRRYSGVKVKHAAKKD